MAKRKTKTKKSAKKSSKKRVRYPEALQKKVVAAVKKGMTHLQASKTHKVGIHSIPKWIQKHAK